LQKGIIQSVQTYEKEYLPEDNIILMGVESGMANQYILDLSKNVRRGSKSKAEKGWRPGYAPLGYKNDLINHTIIKDESRFDLVRKM
jgi:DNA invertase Pin-like site-specific DNA recombinase